MKPKEARHKLQRLEKRRQTMSEPSFYRQAERLRRQIHLAERKRRERNENP